MPSRPFSIHSRVSSFDSISSIVDEKNASPLNKQLDSFTDSDGEVAQNFVQKLRDLSAGNSMNDMCIEKFLMKSEKQFFSEIKKEKMAQGMSGYDKMVEKTVELTGSTVVALARLVHPESPGKYDGWLQT
jgi:hypothetical protein